MVLAPCLLALAGSLAAVADSAALLLAGAVAFGLSWGTMVTGGFQSPTLRFSCLLLGCCSDRYWLYHWS